MRDHNYVINGHVTPVTEPDEATIPAFVPGEPIQYSTHPLSQKFWRSLPVTFMSSTA